jgi:hypothetical protein
MYVRAEERDFTLLLAFNHARRTGGCDNIIKIIYQ